MKTKLFAVALVASAVTIAQANPGAVPAAKVGGPVTRSAPAVHAPMRPGGVLSFRSTPMRSYGSSTFSLTPQGIGIAIGTAIATTGGMVTDAPLLMERG